VAEPLSAAEEAHLRQCSSLGGEDLRRVWATLDAARAERDLLADALAAVSLEIAPELAALRALADTVDGYVLSGGARRRSRGAGARHGCASRVERKVISTIDSKHVDAP